MENKQASGLTNKKLIAIASAIIVLLLGVVIFLLVRQSTTNIPDEGVPKIGYATDATVMLDQAALQAAMDEAMRNAADGNIALRYKNNAYSDDGVTFTCYIANSDANKYDMFLTIFTDAERTDQVFLSGLVPPGSGFEKIELDHALDKGDHKVYVTLTQVETGEDGAQVLKGQVTHTMDFHVS